MWDIEEPNELVTPDWRDALEKPLAPCFEERLALGLRSHRRRWPRLVDCNTQHLKHGIIFLPEEPLSFTIVSHCHACLRVRRLFRGFQASFVLAGVSFGLFKAGDQRSIKILAGQIGNVGRPNRRKLDVTGNLGKYV